MLGKLAKVVEVFRRDGLYTFGYMAAESLRSRLPQKTQYKRWQRIHEKQPADNGNRQRTFTILVPEEISGMCRQSIEVQSYPVCDIVRLPMDADTSVRTVLEKAKGGYIVLLSGQDCLAPTALERVAQYLDSAGYKGCRLIYSDEDWIDSAGRRSRPVFKPGYSPDTLASFFYMGGLLVMERSLLEEIDQQTGCSVQFGGYLMALAASMLIQTGEVCHIPEVLYHRGALQNVDISVLEQEKKRIFAAFGRMVETERVPDCQAVRMLYPAVGTPLVSIVIPSKDNPPMLRQCIEGIVSCTRYDSYEIVVVDNGSSEENRRQYEEICEASGRECSYHYKPMPFNFARMCNLGAGYAKGTYVLFLNDDIEIQNTDGMDWLERLLGQAMQPGIGAVGAKLLYPGTGRIQHIGVVNYAKSAAHLYAGCEDAQVLPGGRNRYDYNVSMVTGACMMIAKDIFLQAGGFCEELEVTYNDVELCIRLLKAGYRQVVRNDVVLLHYESVSRGMDSGSRDRFLRHMRERREVFRRHPEYLLRDDYYSPNLTVKSMGGAVSVQEGPFNREVRHTEALESGMRHGTELRCGLYYADAHRHLRIHGFAYLDGVKYNNMNKVWVVLESENGVYTIPCWKVYDPVFAESADAAGNLNFARFYVDCESFLLEKGSYRVGIVLKRFLTGKKYFHRTETVLDIGKEN